MHDQPVARAHTHTHNTYTISTLSLSLSCASEAMKYSAALIMMLILIGNDGGGRVSKSTEHTKIQAIGQHVNTGFLMTCQCLPV